MMYKAIMSLPVNLKWNYEVFGVKVLKNMGNLIECGNENIPAWSLVLLFVYL